jgi:hypothetical protein
MDSNINSYFDNIVKGLQERDSDIFYDFREFGDFDEDDNPVDPSDGPGRYQKAIMKLCMAAKRAEEIIRKLNDNLDSFIPNDFITLEITPGPWTVISHQDTEGAYIIREVCREQQQWGPDGYDISEEEGWRRHLIMHSHEKANFRLIERAPDLLAMARDLVCASRKKNKQESRR